MLMLMIPFVNSLGMETIRQGEELDYGIGRGMGSVAYAIASWLLGRLTASFGADMISIWAIALTILCLLYTSVFPFVLGGAIAFVTNVPMSFLEKKIFGRAKKEDKIVEKLARPISLFLTIVFAVGVIVLVMFGVIPQLTRTIGTLMRSIADFIPQMQSWIREFSHNNQEIMKLVDQVQLSLIHIWNRQSMKPEIITEHR